MMTKYFPVLFVFIRTESTLLFHQVMWVIPAVRISPKPTDLSEKSSDACKVRSYYYIYGTEKMFRISQ